MALEDKIEEMRAKAIEQGREPVPVALQGVTKDKIKSVLLRIDRHTPDIQDAVFALLDDQQGSWFSNAPATYKFCDGASTAHIACHFGILQRGTRKSDREGRDYWLKPLWEIGAIEKVYYDRKTKDFLPGHPVAKSPNSAYRLSAEFVAILVAPEGQWQVLLSAWMKEDQIRTRLAVQAQLAEQTRKSIDTKHSSLIKASCKYYAPRFLPGFEIIYIDDGDGDRITDAQRQTLEKAGIEITLADSMPDVLLWHPGDNYLWVIEAVTSDGEVDYHKMASLQQLAERSGKAGIGFTTTYQTWKAAAARQGKHKNIAPDSYIWIQEDSSKHLHVISFDGP